jgi:hypothetical protein
MRKEAKTMDTQHTIVVNGTPFVLDISADNYVTSADWDRLNYAMFAIGGVGSTGFPTAYGPVAEGREAAIAEATTATEAGWAKVRAVGVL